MAGPGGLFPAPFASKARRTQDDGSVGSWKTSDQEAIKDEPVGKEPQAGASVPQNIIADLQLRPVAQTDQVRLSGEVLFKQDLVKRFLQQLGTRMINVERPQIDFDAPSGNFVCTGIYQGLPLWHPSFKLALKPNIVGGQLVLHVAGFEHGGPHFLDNYILRKVAQCMTETGYGATFESKGQNFVLDVNQIIRNKVPLPCYGSVTLEGTALAMRAASNGDLLLDVGQGPSPRLPQGKAEVLINGTMLAPYLNLALGDDANVEQIEFKPGHLVIKGTALSPAKVSFGCLFAIFAVATGHDPNISSFLSEVSLDVSERAGDLVLEPRPNYGFVLKKIVRGLAEMGVRSRIEGDRVLVSVSSLSQVAKIDSIKFTAEGVQVAAHPDWNHLLETPQ